MKIFYLILLLTSPCFSSIAQTQLIPLDKDLSTIQYPFEVKFQHLKSQGQDLKMAYVDVLPTTPNGKTIVLLHGKNFNIAYWELTIKKLSNEGFRVIAPDQIGFGKSTKPMEYQYSFQQLAQNTKSILDSLKIDNIILLGHSMGGMLATRFALSYPEMIDKLILENPIGLEDYKILTSYISIDESYQNELNNTAERLRNYQLKYYYDNKWQTEYDPWLNLLAGWTLHQDYPIIAWNAALTTDMIFTQPVVYEFKNIICPTLLIIGTRDRTALGKDRATKTMQAEMGLYNELGKKTNQAIPNSRLIELDNIGHLPHIESFDRFIQPLLEFIRN
jgi:pimeloyl-ACP methyl ester carboxylesterase